MKLRVPVIALKTVDLSRSKKYSIGEGTAHTNTAHSRRRSAKVFIVLLVVLIPVILATLAFKNLNAPAQGTVNQVSSRSAEHQDPYPIPAHYSGKYIDLTYPAHYKRIPSSDAKNYLELVDFYSTDQTNRHISVAVYKGGLSEDSGYSLRLSHPETYQQQPLNRFGITFTSQTANGSESTAFSQHQGMLASISVSAPGSQDLLVDSQTVLTSLKWK